MAHPLSQRETPNESASLKAVDRRSGGRTLRRVLLPVVILALLLGGWWLIGRQVITNRWVARYEPLVTEALNFPTWKGHTFRNTFTQDEINAGLSASPLPVNLGPIQNPRLELLPNSVQIHFVAYGMSNSVQASLGEHDGRLAISEARVRGPFMALLAPGLVARRLEELVNAGLQANDLRLNDLSVSPAAFTFSVRPQQ